MKHKATTRQAYEQQLAVLPYNARNLRVMRSGSRIDRASRGVGEAIMMVNVLPVAQEFHRQATMRVQRSGKKTIKEHHAKDVYETDLQMHIENHTIN